MYNNPDLSNQLLNTFRSYIGEDYVVESSPVMGGEDFGKFGRTEEKIPICLYWLGTISKEKIELAEEGKLKLPSLHSPYFAPDAQTSIETGVITMTGAVLELLKK